jgi:hypothetical protein
VRLERGPLSFVNITDELLEWKNSGSCYRNPRLTAVGIRSADPLSAKVVINLTDKRWSLGRYSSLAG